MCREGENSSRPADRNLTILQRLAQHLKHMPGELRKLIEKKYALVCEADLAGPWNGAAPISPPDEMV